MGAVVNAFLEAKLSVGVELCNPSVPDFLSRRLEVREKKQMEDMKEHLFHQTRQKAEDNIFDCA